MMRDEERLPAEAGGVGVSAERLLCELRGMMEEARHAVASAANVALTFLYWRVGKRLREEIMNGERAEYGKRILQTVSAKLTAEYGRGFSEKSLRHMVRFAEAFPEEGIVSALMRQLSWTHFLAIIYLSDPFRGISTPRCAAWRDGARGHYRRKSALCSTNGPLFHGSRRIWRDWSWMPFARRTD